jgi:hypothetical protein
VRRRWAFIFWPSLVCLVGLSWSTTKFGGSIWHLLGIHLLGMIVACAVGFFAMRQDARRRRPAIVALLGAAPMVVTMYERRHEFSFLWEWFGVSAVLAYGGAVLTALSALVIAVLPMPPLDDERVAKAQTIREDAR